MKTNEEANGATGEGKWDLRRVDCAISCRLWAWCGSGRVVDGLYTRNNLRSLGIVVIVRMDQVELWLIRGMVCNRKVLRGGRYM